MKNLPPPYASPTASCEPVVCEDSLLAVSGSAIDSLVEGTEFNDWTIS